MPANGKPMARFELPALAPLNFSLTEGTDIPPPPDSPIEEQPPPPAPESEPVAANAASTNGQNGEAKNSNVGHDSRGRTSTVPLSPVSATRPGSIRRFLSRRSLNVNYTNGTNHNGSQENLAGIGRPDSPSSFLNGKPGLVKKKTSGSWFKRMTSTNGNYRTNVIYENKQEEEEKKGPPAPKLPELSQLKAKVEADDSGSLGGDELFKNIK